MKLIKLLRLIFYNLGALLFFLGGLLRLLGTLGITMSDIVVAAVFFVCAMFYVLGGVTDTIIYIKEQRTIN